MPNGTYGGVRGRKTKVGRKLLRFPPTRFVNRWISEESENRKVKNPNALLSGERRTKSEETTFDVSQFKC